MSGVTIQVQFKDAALQDWFVRARKVLTGGKVENIIGTVCHDKTMRHLSDLNYSRTRGGGKGFYEQAASKVQLFSKPGYVMVTTEHQGLAQRYWGGRIEPRNKRCLAFPVGDSPTRSAGRTNQLAGKNAWGESAAGGLRAIFFKPRITAHSEIFGALVPAQAHDMRVAVGVFSSGKRKDQTKYAPVVLSKTGKLPILFLLARWVEQDADPSVMPSEAVYAEFIKISLRRIVPILEGRN